MKVEINYTTTEKDCLAVVYAVKNFKTYFYGRACFVIMDHDSL